jgi:mRNA-degrading endonuclease toxin of MazEF toxin-antitoxin module
MASPDELWLTDFGDPFPGEPAFHRPALIVGPPSYFGADFPFVLVVPLTTTDRGLSLHVEIEADKESGLDTVSHAQCELLRSVNQRRLVHRIGVIDSARRERVSEIIATLLNL